MRVSSAFVLCSLLSLLAVAATGCLKSQRVVDNCFPTDTVIDGALAGDFFVGFTRKEDPATHTNPSSPTVRFTGSVSSGPDALTPTQDTLGGITVYNKSVFLMEGGSINGYLIAKDDSQVTLSGGTIKGVLEADDASVVTVRGGTVAFGMHVTRKATLTINGGEMSSPAVYDNSVLNLNGGKTSGSLIVTDKATVHLRGGTPPDYLTVYDHATLNIYGTGLKKTLVNARNQNGYSSQYQLSGKLSDGTDMGNVFLIVENSRKPVVRFIKTTP